MTIQFCPFCDSSNVSLEVDELNIRKWYGWVKCNNCGARGSTEIDKNEAIKNWNKVVNKLHRDTLIAGGPNE